MRQVSRAARVVRRGTLAVAVVAVALPAQVPNRAELLHDFAWRSIGPANLGGRVDDIEAVPGNPDIVYVGGANSGVWKTANGGTTWVPVFDAQPNLSIGDIAIARSNPNIVWVGTGEANARQSTTYGAGVYKSIDAGRTWSFMGLRNSGHIGRILVDPRNANVVMVAALGDLFKPDSQRGLYRTTDGGRTWTKAKYIDENTGFTELAMDPSNSNILLAASYQRRRTAWGYNGGGPGSALWRSVNGGRTWTRVEGGGLPPYGNWGRVGLDFSRSNPNIVYAVIEPGPVTGGRGGRGGRGAAPGGPPDPQRPGLWRSEDTGRTWHLVSNEDGRPIYFSQVRVDPKDPNTLFILERTLAHSTDGGRTFTAVPEAMLARLQNPDQPSVVPPWQHGPGDAFPASHPDHHAMWIDPSNPHHIWLGHDGGVDYSADGGRSWRYVNWMPIGQFYEVAADMRQPYWVWGGAQDSGIWGLPSRVRNGGGITNEHVSELALGDGYHVLSDPTDWATVYAEVSGNGGQHIWRYNLRTGEQKYIRPTPPRRPGQGGQAVAVGPAGNIVTPLPPDEALRFNWNPGLAMSPHNPDILYFGANRLFTSYDRGDSWVASPDLTKHLDRDSLSIMGVPGSSPMSSKNDGVAQWGTIVAVTESPVMPGVLWVGTDDGNLQVSRDGGATWTNVADNAAKFPTPYYVDAIEASHKSAGTAYASFDGHRAGDYRPHLYRTTDFGTTWTDLSTSLPERGHINVVREDPVNHDLLLVGTENGFYLSLDGGREFTRFMNGLPATISDDVLIHPRDHDLVLATHGRSFYILDDITALEQLADSVLTRDEFLFAPRQAILWDQDRTTFHGGAEDMWRAKNPPDAVLSYYLKGAAQGPVKIQVADVAGTIVREFDAPRDAGIHRIEWDLTQAGPAGASGSDATAAPGARIAPGTYAVRLVANGRTSQSTLSVTADPNR